MYSAALPALDLRMQLLTQHSTQFPTVKKIELMVIKCKGDTADTVGLTRTQAGWFTWSGLTMAAAVLLRIAPQPGKTSPALSGTELS